MLPLFTHVTVIFVEQLAMSFFVNLVKVSEEIIIIINNCNNN